MELRLNRDSLAEALNAARSVVTSKGQTILQGVRLQAADQLLGVASSRIGLSLHATLEASVLREGDSIVRHDLLYGFVARAESSTVAMESGNGELLLVAGGARAHLQEFDPENWPQVPSNVGKWSRWSNEVLSAVAGVLHAAALPESGSTP